MLVANSSQINLARLSRGIWQWFTGWNYVRCDMLLRVGFRSGHVVANVQCHLLWLSPNICNIVYEGWRWILWATMNHKYIMLVIMGKWKLEWSDFPWTIVMLPCLFYTTTQFFGNIYTWILTSFYLSQNYRGQFHQSSMFQWFAKVVKWSCSKWDIKWEWYESKENSWQAKEYLRTHWLGTHKWELELLIFLSDHHERVLRFRPRTHYK
jgi:hypothetical protein